MAGYAATSDYNYEAVNWAPSGAYTVLGTTATDGGWALSIKGIRTANLSEIEGSKSARGAVSQS
jgi:hypothetical protein